MATDNERKQILEMIDRGVISAEDGSRLLKALETTPEDVESVEEPMHFIGTDGATEGEAERVVDAEVLEDEIKRWKRWWTIPLWIGMAVVVLAAVGMASLVQAGHMNFWFYCLFVPLFIGVLLMVMAWQSRTGHWLHVRVDQRKGQGPKRIAFSMPLPLKLTGWFFRNFGHYIPNLKEKGVEVDTILESLNEGLSPESPLYVKVDEDGDGDKVEVYIS